MLDKAWQRHWSRSYFIDPIFSLMRIYWAWHDSRDEHLLEKGTRYRTGLDLLFRRFNCFFFCTIMQKPRFPDCIAKTAERHSWSCFRLYIRKEDGKCHSVLDAVAKKTEDERLKKNTRPAFAPYRQDCFLKGILAYKEKFRSARTRCSKSLKRDNERNSRDPMRDILDQFWREIICTSDYMLMLTA